MAAFQQFADLPAAKFLFISAALAFFILGTHYVTYRHCKRVGRKWSFFSGFVSLLPQFNASEWCILVASYILTIASFVFALHAG